MNTGILRFFGGTGLLIRGIFRELMTPPFYFRLTFQQVYAVGLKSLPLVLIVALSSGMVMALQFGVGLQKFGGELYVPKIVSLSIVRELGPVFACLMIAARVGAGITSEIGSMKVTQQLDAIRALGTSPIKKIVIPRVLASLIAVPVLSVIAIAVGIAGGLFVGASELGLDPYFYIQKIVSTVTVSDFYSGICKTPFFALLIAITSCYYGLNVKGGTRGVGLATTKSVVSTCILIVVGDFFLTKLFILIQQLL